jgi:hypothetical protein
MMFHRSAYFKTVLLAAGFAALAAAVVLTRGQHNVQRASAFPAYQQDCSSCHGPGFGTYTNHVTAVPSTTTLAPGGAYTVTITLDASTDGGNRGYWIANSDAAGTTGATTGIYAYYLPTPQAMTAPVLPGTYYYKVFGQSGKQAVTGAVGFAIYSITVGAAPPTSTPVPPTSTPVPPTSTPVPPTSTPVPPTSTPVPPTSTPVPPTNTPVPPTNTPVPPTNTPVPPTSTAVPPTSTPVPPTSTPAPPTNTPVPPTVTPVVPPTNTAVVPPTNTPVPPTNTPTSVPTATDTPVPPTATPTSTPGACLTFWQKLDLTIGITRRLGAHAGDRGYRARYDVNGDGVIDALDLLQVASTATCSRGHDDGDEGIGEDAGEHGTPVTAASSSRR